MSSALSLVPSTVFPPTTTSGPDLIPSPTAFNLSKRADHIPSNICGWFSGSGYDQKWTYNDPSVTCFWNSDAHFVGNAIPPQTACVGEAQWSTWSCSGSGCSSSVARCTGTQPYCVTFSYGTDYLSFVCSEKEGIEYQMEPYWSGFRDPIAFPVYTGSNGISTGTQYPAGYPTPSSTTSSSSSSTTTTSASGTSPGTSGSSATSNPSDHRGSSAPVGAIVGGVIGGLAFISLIAGAIIFFLMHRRRRPQPGQYQQPASGFPPGSQPPASQYPHPANPAMNTGFPSNASAPINPLPGQGPPQNPPTQQPPRHEIETEYNKPELDISRQQPEQTYLNQQPELPGMQPLQPEYVSMAQQPSKAELGSHSGGIKASNRAEVVSAGHRGKEGNIYEAP